MSAPEISSITETSTSGGYITITGISYLILIASHFNPCSKEQILARIQMLFQCKYPTLNARASQSHKRASNVMLHQEQEDLSQPLSLLMDK
jgi:hypothetical protein